MTPDERKQYVQYRIETAYKTFDAAKVLYDNGFYNSAINRLYYSLFYAINALLVKNEIYAQTHSGIRNQFSLHFIKTMILDKKHGRLFSELFDWRQKGDYGNMFDFDKKTVYELFSPVYELLNEINKIL